MNDECCKGRKSEGTKSGVGDEVRKGVTVVPEEKWPLEEVCVSRVVYDC